MDMLSCPTTGEPVCRCLGDQAHHLAMRPSARSTLRKLFTDHAVYTNKYSIAYIAHLGSADALLNRLLDNQQEIGMYLGQFLGAAVGEAITAILTEHIQLAGKALEDIAHRRPIAPTMQKILANVDKFATAVAKLTGVKTDYQKWYKEFLHHNEMVLEIAKLNIKGLYIQENEAYDTYYTHMLRFSDMMCSDLLMR